MDVFWTGVLVGFMMGFFACLWYVFLAYEYRDE